MKESFIHEIDKQISSNLKLYNQTKFEIFHERLVKLESLKNEILKFRQKISKDGISPISSTKIRNYLIKKV